jgi:hypothetical protein
VRQRSTPASVVPPYGLYISSKPIGWVDVSGAPRVVLALGGQIFRRGRPVIGRGHISEARWSSVTLGAVRGEVDALGVL